MEFDNIPLDSGPSDFEQDGEDLAVYMNSQIARATFEAELNAIADGELCGPTPRFGKWTEAHELMAEVESPTYLPMDIARGELFEEDEELGYLMREQGRYFAGDGYPSRRQLRTTAQALRVASNREVLRRIRRPRAFSDIQKRSRRAAYFPLASRRIDPEGK